jgi:hypothetical protein
MRDRSSNVPVFPLAKDERFSPRSRATQFKLWQTSARKHNFGT